ncbi:hypothetical protein BDY19DRAFT_989366 [Irpex rosettiformis]|uniref:Uncharacterized protein n=1 Tax=Irpex rosettiformis TaxID=378272 RepID=A0ACB8UHS0_9APHY|nr:hypothetical protein BDY19DRAFT_989366 [Irpex rosettiformis]
METSQVPHYDTDIQEKNVTMSPSDVARSCITFTRGMRLDFDVLFIIMDFLGALYVRPMMMTCSTLYERGIPCLFKDNLRITKRNMESFCSFMTRDLSRCKHLIWVQFLFWRLREPLATQLVTILLHASKLEYLILDPMCLDADPRFADAVASLPSLNNVQINGQCQDISRVFCKAKGPISSVEAYPAAQDGSPADFIKAFSGVKETLVQLILRDAVWEVHYDIVYPKLTTLIMWDPQECTVQSLITSFPNLRHLSVVVRSRGDDENDPFGWIEDFDAERGANMATQARDGSWTHLETVRGDINILYALGLSCRVQNLHIRMDGPEISEDDTDRYLLVVEPMRPDYLHLTISSLSLQHMLIIILQTLITGAKKFSLDIHLPTEGDNACAPKEFVNILTQCIPYFRTLHSLEINISWRDPRPGQTYSDSWWGSDTEDEELYTMSDSGDEGDEKKETPESPNATAGGDTQPGNDLMDFTPNDTEVQPSPEPASVPTASESTTSNGKHSDYVYMKYLPLHILMDGIFRICPNLLCLRLSLQAHDADGTARNEGQWARAEEGGDPINVEDSRWSVVSGIPVF